MIVFNFYLRKIVLQEVGEGGGGNHFTIGTQLWFPVCGTTKYHTQRKATVFFCKLKKKCFRFLERFMVHTCIERTLNGFLDIQDACTAPQIINKWSRSLHLL